MNDIYCNLPNSFLVIESNLYFFNGFATRLIEYL